MTTPNDERPGNEDPVWTTAFSPGEWGCLGFALVVGIYLVLRIIL